MTVRTVVLSQTTELNSSIRMSNEELPKEGSKPKRGRPKGSGMGAKAHSFNIRPQDLAILENAAKERNMTKTEYMRWCFHLVHSEIVWDFKPKELSTEGLPPEVATAVERVNRQKAYRREYYQKNKEKFKRTSKKWYKANKAKRNKQRRLDRKASVDSNFEEE